MSNWLSTCRNCGQMIAWDTTKNGKRVPIDPDGRFHFISCSAKQRGKVQPKAIRQEGS